MTDSSSVADPALVVAADVDGLARVAADRVRALAADALAARGRFRFALAGGSTPRALYAHLAVARDLDWSRVDVFFGDERAVGPDDPQSNYRMARETLLSPASVPADVTDGHALQVRAVVDQHRISEPLGPHGPDLPAQVQPGIDGAGELADRFQSISQVLIGDCGYSR